MKSDKTFEAVHYGDYLQLDKILEAQKLRSSSLGEPAHDEMLFIIIHQVYELWFKEIKHELSSIMEMFKKDNVDEKSLSIAVSRMDRILEIMQILIAQVRVIETITPLDFLDFRNALIPASGFQSLQFREVEVLLGLKRKKRITYGDTDYACPFNHGQQAELQEKEDGNSMLQLLEKWLERIPFLNFGEFDFISKYKDAVDNMIANEKNAIMKSDYITEDQKSLRLRMISGTKEFFEAIMNEDRYKELQDEGHYSISYKSTFSALLINIYRDEPILQMPYRLISQFVELDEALTTWRYRHAQMVFRMLGKKIGTGGSSGYDYLKSTSEKHHIFGDLATISTLLIPRSEIPELTKELKKQFGFNYNN